MTIDENDLEKSTDNELIEIIEGKHRFGTPSVMVARIILRKRQEEKQKSDRKRTRQILILTVIIAILTAFLVIFDIFDRVIPKFTDMCKPSRSQLVSPNREDTNPSSKQKNKNPTIQNTPHPE